MSNIWVDDGSNVITSAGATVKCSSEDTGSPANALYKDGPGFTAANSPVFWTIKLSAFEQPPFIGLASEDNFQKGWAVKGFFFGGPGNVSSGSSGLITGFDDKGIKVGAEIGILAEVVGGSFKIYFYHDGRPLGQAFDLPVDKLKPLFPCLQFTGKGEATIQKGNVPAEKTRKNDYDPNSMIGYWKLETAPFPTIVGNSSFTVHEDGVRATLKIINTISFTLKKTGDNWSFTAGASTQMGSDPEVMRYETRLSTLMGQVTGVEIENDTMTCSCSGEIVWKRSFKVFKPINLEKLNVQGGRI